VPHLYAWQSCKWVRSLIFMEGDKPGYWEELGYHTCGDDPFREQRFSSDWLPSGWTRLLADGSLYSGIVVSQPSILFVFG
jgi:DMSO/TMAO reductase YedYZ molybdopterin-dependent catalytic subunit